MPLIVALQDCERTRSLLVDNLTEDRFRKALLHREHRRDAIVDPIEKEENTQANQQPAAECER
jgi:hypothetical protein